MNSNTVWPETLIAEPVKKLMSLLLSLLDNKGDEAGPRLADEVFTPNGVLGAANGSAIGSAGLSIFLGYV